MVLNSAFVRGRLTTGWRVSGAESFRLASGKLLKYYGGNLQNPSDSLMRCIEPPKGHVFMQPDQSGAEALIVAMEAPKGKFRRLFELNIKVHSYMALQIFIAYYSVQMKQSMLRYKNVDPDIFATYPEFKALLKLIKEHDDHYFLGKKTIHAGNYGMRWKTFQLSALEESQGKIRLSAPESKRILDAHVNTFPEIVVLQKEIEEEVLATRTITNLFGFPRKFHGVWNDNMLRQALAWRPQSTVATITNEAFTKMDEYIEENNLPWEILNNKHDSILLSLPDTDEHRQHARAKAKEFIECPLVSTHGESFNMKSEISWGYNWGKKAEDNPNGMEGEK